MKKLFLLVFCFCILIVSPAQTWQWAKQIGGNCYEYKERAQLLCDGSNSYLLGSYCGFLSLPSDSLLSNGNNDNFIAKFDANGILLWSKTFGGSYYDPTNFTHWDNCIGSYDPVQHCIYIVGKLYGTVHLDTISPLTSSGDDDIFLAKMDLNGNFIWAKKGGGNGFDQGDVYVNNDGKIYLITRTDDSSHFDGFNLPPGGGLIQYDMNGNCLSAEIKFNLIPQPGFNNVNLKFTNKGMYYYGYFESDTFQLDTCYLYNQGNDDGFIAFADSNGSVKWIKSFGGLGKDKIGDISFDANGNIYLSGEYEDSTNFLGAWIVNNGQDNFIAKLDSSGSLVWVQTTSMTGDSTGRTFINTDVDGISYFSGQFGDSASFGSFTTVTTNPVDYFVARYDENGTCIGVVNVGEAISRGMTVDSSGNILCLGEFKNSITLNSTSMTSYGDNDLFLAKLGAITDIETIERKSNNQLFVYSNPSDGTFNIIVPDDVKTLDKAWLYVYDNSGKETAKFSLDGRNDRPHFDITNKAKGMYAVKLVQGDKVYSGKIIIQ